MEPKLRVAKKRSMSDEAVKKATGKTWDQWFKLLDAKGGKKLEHQSLAQLVHEELGVSPWWSQMVTVEYERARAKRVVHQTATGFSVSKTKTVAVPVSKLYRAFADAKRRAAWLDVPMKVTKTTKDKSLYAQWSEGNSRLAVQFNDKGPSKSSVAVQESKLADAKTAARTKAFWTARLEQLATELE